MARPSKLTRQQESTRQQSSCVDEDKLETDSEPELDGSDVEDYQGSLEGESEDEWAEERKAVRYVAESEMEDDADSTSGSSSDQSSSNHIETSNSKSIGYLLKSFKTNEPSNNNQRTKGKTDDEKKPNGGIKHSSDDEEPESKYQSTRKSIPTRSNKHAPIEITSKRAVTRKRTIVQVPKTERRDPRFDTLSGAVNEDLHDRSFGFLKAQRQAELEKMREIIRKAKKSGRKSIEIDQLEDDLRREENREVQREKMELEKKAIRAWKATEREKRKEGKGAFYLKKKAQKQIVLANRYEHLSQNKSKLHKSIEKKRKKVDGKEKKSMPFSRQRRDSNNNLAGS